MTIPAPSIVYPQEEWNDTDFDLPEGVPLSTQSDAESDNEMEDWDLEMSLGKTGGAKVSLSSSPLAPASRSYPNMITIRPPMPQSSDEDDFDDEGASTIKVSHMPPIRPKTPIRNQDDDIEEAFELPEELTQLSLRPVELRHRQSKSSLEWGDRDHTGSSTSSDAYSTFGFAPSASPSSISTSAPSIGELDTDDDDDDEGELDGLVLPSGIFDSKHGGKHLAKILEEKKRLPIVNDRVKPPTTDAEDDFEIGLIIDDDFDLSPSRLPSNRLNAEKKPVFGRSKSAPARPPVQPFRPSSRLGAKDRPKSPNAPPVSAGISRVRPLVISQPTSARPTLSRKSTFQVLSVAPSSLSPSTLSPGPFQVQSPTSSTLRTQKSHCVLKPPSPRSTMTRKASLSSLIDTAAAAAVPSSSLQSPTSYAAPTAASRARSQAIQAQFYTHSAAQSPSYYPVPPTRPTTPSASTAALRLTMPTSSSRAKIRPTISAVFNIGPSKDKDGRSSPNSRPPSTLSSGSSSKSPSSPPLRTGAKILKRPKKARTYGDGTELDGIEDLPADREKEARYRVTPKGTGAPRLGLNKNTTEKQKEKVAEIKGTIGRKAGLKRESENKPATASTTGTLRRKDRIDFLSAKPATANENQPRKVSKKKTTPAAPSGVATGTTRRKPTLIRNLGGVGSPKVVGDMRWNPATLRWEGNENILRDFDAVTSSSTRPALITHLTGSSIGSPVGAGSFAAAGARIVGNMIFDPQRMCWISRLPPEEDEPDPFADLADDEDDWESRGGTIRATSAQGQDQSLATVATRGDTPSPGRPTSGRHSRAMSESESERGARPALKGLQDVDGKLLEKCKEAEERHRAEMKGWKLAVSDEPDLAALFEIRQLATRQY